MTFVCVSLSLFIYNIITYLRHTTFRTPRDASVSRSFKDLQASIRRPNGVHVRSEIPNNSKRPCGSVDMKKPLGVYMTPCLSKTSMRPCDTLFVKDLSASMRHPAFCKHGEDLKIMAGILSQPNPRVASRRVKTSWPRGTRPARIVVIITICRPTRITITIAVFRSAKTTIVKL